MRRRGLVAVACAIIGAVAGIHWVASGHFFGGAEPDAVPQDEIARRAANLAALQPVPLPVVPAAEHAAAIAGMHLPNSDREALAADVQAGRVSLVWVTLFDSDVEDGDAVTVSSGGLSKPLVLTKQPERLALPAPADGLLRITATRDGAGGGVTVGMVTPSGPMPLAVMSVGQTITVPVASR